MIEFKDYCPDNCASIAMCDDGWQAARAAFMADHALATHISAENQYGEPYMVAIYAAVPIGLLLHSDAESWPYPVVDGVALNIILNKEEKAEIMHGWNMFVDPVPPYGIESSCAISDATTFLTNDACPLCLKQKSDWNRHHVVWACEGGRDEPVNMLRICRDCHALVTMGDVKSLTILGHTAYFHQLAIHGVAFYPRGTGEKRYKDKTWLDANLVLAKALQRFDELDDETKQEANSAIKKEAWLKYVLWRTMALGHISWQSYVDSLG